MEDIFAIGRIVRPHGIKGGVKVLPINDIEITYSDLKIVYVGKNMQKANVVGFTKLNNAFVLFLDIIKDTNHADQFRNNFIYIKREDYKNIFENTLVPSDMIGADLCDENDEKIGVIVDVNNYGSTPILTINCVGCSYDIPYVDVYTKYDKAKNVVKINKATFEDIKV